jgi:CPA2 family monovalent cation:H+ antiporter-2
MSHGSEYTFPLIFLLCAVVVVSFFHKHRISSVLAYLLIGVLLGPHVLGLDQHSEGAEILGGTGILFLMFAIGLELPWERLKVLRTYVLGLGLWQVVVTGACFTGLALLTRIHPKAAIVLGGALALSSTAVVLQELSERREMATRHGRIAFSVLLFQDFAAIGLLMFANMNADASQTVVAMVGQTLVRIVLVFGVIWFFAHFVLGPLYRTIALLKSSELFMATTLLVVLGTSFVTQLGGLSRELGAFIAGLMLASTEYRHQVEADIHPFRGLLLGMFFVTMGVSIDLSLLVQDPAGVFGLLGGMIVLKGVLILMLCGLFRFPLRTGIRLAFLLSSGGEFLFVLVSPQLAIGLIDSLLHPYIVLCTALSMALTPLLNQGGIALVRRFCEDEESPQTESAGLKNHVIIVGFGSLGRMMAELLKRHQISFVVLDVNVQKVTEGRKLGFPVFMGDVKRTDLLSAVGGDRARTILVAIKKQSFAVRIALSVRKMFPDAQVVLGVNEEQDTEKLVQAGIKVVVHDTMEQSLTIAQHVLGTAGVGSDHIRHDTDYIRRTRSMAIPPFVPRQGG